MQLGGLAAVMLCALPLILAHGDPGDLNSELLWGTYRPNLYFGTRPRLANSLVSGLMWFGLNGRHWQSIRHSCELGDNLSEYGYSRHNGRDFGEQTMRDSDQGVEIKSSFIKVPGDAGGSWAVRFTGRTLNEESQGVSLVYYFGLEGNGTMSTAVDNNIARVRGRAPELGKFSIRIVPAQSNQHPVMPKEFRGIGGIRTDGNRISGVGLKVPKTDVWKAKDIFQDVLLDSARTRARAMAKHAQGAGQLPGSMLFGLDNAGLRKKGTNMFFAQMNVHGEFAFDVIYECADKTSHIDSDAIDAIASNRRKEFDARFETSFSLREKGFSEAQIEMARNALSSLIGGIGYFHGSGLVSSKPKPEFGAEGESEAELGEPYSLFAATPSRPFFPRGFLWDEGFHQLVLRQWDSDLSLEIIRSWFSAMDDNGWIAREQILGDEARSKVPREFQVQYPNFANPPTILFAVEAIAERLLAHGITARSADMLQGAAEEGTCDEQCLLRNKLESLAPYTTRLLSFFQKSQIGESMDESPSNAGYRWRGRTENHTLTSGLDDYPRASVPGTGELHVDLYSWVAYMVRLNAELTGTGDAELASHLEMLDKIHWNEQEKMYCDVNTGVREDYDELEDEDDGLERVFVCHRGYVSLFPMLLGLVPPDSDKLGHILDMIVDPEELWTEFGVRSLSKRDEYYGQGENYWRGPIWININYLILSSLHRNYMGAEGPYQEQARSIYTRLRENLMGNVFEQYQSSRFFWEQYNPEDGSGQRTHPFTGWTTLIVLIMAEKY
ncbi:Processing alpha glucosidase I [Coemansia sp. RSA 2050]|nr:Processing alpha glucosidase I [Coemansia sp. RSA 2050]KAJ2734115.1 Processing alpha glucosidase I [Coemansia sp. BCRC 34962]